MLRYTGSMVKGPATTWCYVSNMDRAVAFYRDLLGLEPSHVSPYWTAFQLGGMRLGLHPAVAGNEGPHGIYGKGWFLGLEVDDIRALKSALKSAGVEVKGDFHDVPGAVVLDFLDPDGNTLEAYQPGITVADLK